MQFQIECQESLRFLLGTKVIIYGGGGTEEECFFGDNFAAPTFEKSKNVLPNFKYHLKNRYTLLSIKNTIKLSDRDIWKTCQTVKRFL
jgi:hypothetical protein